MEKLLREGSILYPRLIERRHHVARDLVVPAVIAPLHHHNVIAPGVGAGKAQGMVGGFGTGQGELNLVQRRDALNQQFRCAALPGRGSGTH
jgi:hypothetical protein